MAALRLLRFALFLLLLAGPAWGQTTWYPVEGPYGGTVVDALVVAADGSILAGSHGGVFRSTDNGNHWLPDHDGLTVQHVDALLVLPDGTELAGTAGDGLFRRAPGTRRWQPTALRGVFINALARADSGALYAATDQKLIYSPDGGATWIAAPQINDRSMFIADVVTLEDYVFIATTEGLFRTDDDGATWTAVHVGLQNLDVTALAVGPTGDLVAGTSPLTGCTLYRSRTQGDLWTCIEPSVRPLQVQALAYAPDGTLYAGAYQRVFQSADGGDRWNWATVSATTVRALAFNYTYAFAGTLGQGIHRVTYSGDTWASASKGLPSIVNKAHRTADGTFYVATEGGVYRSPDGYDWTPLVDGLPFAAIQDLVLDAQGRPVVATFGGVYRYDEAAASWAILGPPGNPITNTVTLGTDGALYAGYYQGVYRYQDQTWYPLPVVADGAERNVSAMAIDASGRIYAGARWDSFRLMDDGSTWGRMTVDGLVNFSALAFAVDGATVYAGTRFLGVVRSTDGGHSWAQLLGGMTNMQDIRALAITPNGTAYAGTFGSGVFRYDAPVDRWVAVNTGLTTLRVQSLLVDEDGVLYAGTYGGGLFRLGSPVPVGTEATAAVPGTLVLQGVFPQPAPAQATLQFALPAPAQVSVAVFDVLGRQVQAMPPRWMAAGAVQRLGLDLSGLPAGLYVYRLTAETAAGTERRAGTIVRMQ